MIKRGDQVLVSGKEAVAISDEYHKMVYDSYDHDLDFWSYEVGAAMNYINVKYENGIEAVVPLKLVKKI